MTDDEMQGQLSAVNTAYADMLAYMLHALVEKGVFSPKEGGVIVGMGRKTLELHPLQGEVTRDALDEFDQLADYITSTPVR